MPETQNDGNGSLSRQVAAARERLAEKLGSASPAARAQAAPSSPATSIVRLSDDDRELLSLVLDELQQLRRDLGFRKDAIPVDPPVETAAAPEEIAAAPSNTDSEEVPEAATAAEGVVSDEPSSGPEPTGEA